MKPGQKPKPTKAQIAAGDPRKKGVHKLEEQLAAEPKASRGLPPCPEYLVGRARDAWTFWSHELELMDLDNLRTRCNTCHSAKTMRETASTARVG